VLETTAKQLDIGTPVKMVWQDITEDRALPQWTLA